MKKIAFAAFVAFWSSVATLLITTAIQQSAAVAADAEVEQVFTLEELSEHNTAQDCWMAIKGEVYNLTSYMSDHPAPPVILAGWCGKEATEGMTTKGYGRDHSAAAYALLESYRIGTLEI